MSAPFTGDLIPSTCGGHRLYLQLDSLLGSMRSVRIRIGEGFLPDVVALAWCPGGRRLQFSGWHELLLGQGGPLRALRKRLTGPRERRRKLGRSSWLADHALGNG
jgi:hypothetical protein